MHNFKKEEATPRAGDIWFENLISWPPVNLEVAGNVKLKPIKSRLPYHVTKRACQTNEASTSWFTSWWKLQVCKRIFGEKKKRQSITCVDKRSWHQQQLLEQNEVWFHCVLQLESSKIFWHLLIFSKEHVVEDWNICSCFIAMGMTFFSAIHINITYKIRIKFYVNDLIMDMV